MKNYALSIAWSEEDGGYIAVVPEFRHLSAFGLTWEESAREIKDALESHMEAYQQEGLPLPKEITRSPYSGQIRVRMPRHLHEQLAALAQIEHVSLNQLIVSMLSTGYGWQAAIVSAPRTKIIVQFFGSSAEGTRAIVSRTAGLLQPPVSSEGTGPWQISI